MTRQIVHYTGTDERGKAQGGSSSDTAPLARMCFEAGWRALTVTAADDGREVAGIVVVGGERTWWAEGASGHEQPAQHDQPAVGIPYAVTDPSTGARTCPACHRVISEEYDARGEMTSNNYGEHYASDHLNWE